MEAAVPIGREWRVADSMVTDGRPQRKSTDFHVRQPRLGPRPPPPRQRRPQGTAHASDRRDQARTGTRLLDASLLWAPRLATTAPNPPHHAPFDDGPGAGCLAPHQAHTDWDTQTQAGSRGPAPCTSTLADFGWLDGGVVVVWRLGRPCSSEAPFTSGGGAKGSVPAQAGPGALQHACRALRPSARRVLELGHPTPQHLVIPPVWWPTI